MSALTLTENRARQFLALTKPRVVSLIVFTAVIGMFLAAPGLPPASAVVFGTLGIALVAGAAAAINCLVEQKIDAMMARTRTRPLPRGEISSMQTLIFACAIGAIGLGILYFKVNTLTMWLTLLPVTHGSEYTRLMIVLYTAALFAVTLLPFAIRMSGLLYLAAALALGVAFFGHALALYRRYSDSLARRTFRFSILYLAAL